MIASVPPQKLRVTVVAMTVGFGSAPYVQLLPKSLNQYARVSLIMPSHMKDPIEDVDVGRFVTGHSPKAALLQSLRPWTHVDLVRQVRRTHPDIVHILNGHGYPWSVAISAFLPPVPIAVTLHDPTPHPGNLTDAVNARLGRFTLSRASAIHIHDEIFRPEIEARFPGKSVFVIRHPSFASRYLQHRRPGITRERRILFFGRVEYYKGIEILLRAAQFLPSDVAMTVAGAGSLSATEQSMAAALGDRFSLLNRFIDDAEVAVLMQRAGVLALPYLQATQSSLPLIAAAFDLPVVASSVGAFTTEVPALGGLTVPPANPQALAAALLAQLDRPRPIHNEQRTFDDLAPSFMAMYRTVVG